MDILTLTHSCLSLNMKMGGSSKDKLVRLESLHPSHRYQSDVCTKQEWESIQTYNAIQKVNTFFSLLLLVPAHVCSEQRERTHCLEEAGSTAEVGKREQLSRLCSDSCRQEQGSSFPQNPTLEGLDHSIPLHKQLFLSLQCRPLFSALCHGKYESPMRKSYAVCQIFSRATLSGLFFFSFPFFFFFGWGRERWETEKSFMH